jgi:hypothetical protein
MDRHSLPCVPDKGRKMRMTRSRACTHMIERLADGLANHMPFAAASRAGVTIVCEKWQVSRYA